MADDLVERLKRKGKLDAELLIQRRAFGHVHGLIEACAEAAARIARLEAALRPFADWFAKLAPELHDLIESGEATLDSKFEGIKIREWRAAAAALADAPDPGQAKAPPGG